MFDAFTANRFATLDDSLSETGSGRGSGRFREGDGPATTSAFGDIASYQICGCCGVFRGPNDGTDGGGQGLIFNGDDRGGFGNNGKPSLLTGDAGAQITRTNQSWATALGTPATVTYAFRATAVVMPTDTTGFTQFSASQIAATIRSLSAWSDVANITFNRVDDGAGYSDNATILLGNYSSGQSGAAAFAYLPGGQPGNTAVSANAGNIWINSSLSYNANPIQGGYGQLTLLHEIGHAIGLSHPAAYNASASTGPTYGADATYFEDSLQYSVMSYFNEQETGADYRVNGVGTRFYASVPQLDDISAVQRLYGANTTTRAGDTTYGFNSNAGQSWFSASFANSVLIFAVWDAGGNDTFDFSGYSSDSTIDLRQAAFSSVGGLTGNVSIALGAVIENAIGGSGNDTIRGNSGDNRLTGGGGNDTIDGGLGSDTVVFSGARSSYTITWNGQVGTVSGPGGTVTVRNVEFLAFSDGTIAAAPTGGLSVSGDITNETINGTALGDTLGGLGGNDVLNGLDGNDRLDGGFGTDTLNGGNGDDILAGGLGNDTLNGGSGVDIADYSGATTSVTVNLALGTSTGAHGSDTFVSIEGLTGSTFGDVLTGDANANVIRGGGGVDTLNGGGGNDQLFAGAPGESSAATDIIKGAGTANATIGTAVSLAGGFDKLANPDIGRSTTVPHATVVASTHGGVEYYAVTVAAGDVVVFDIDGASFDSTLRLFDANGVELSSNDDSSSDSGSRGTDSGLSYTFTAAGTYYIQVAEWDTNQGNTFTSKPPAAGGSYTLHVSVPSAPFAPTVLTGSTLNGDAGDDLLTSGLGNDTLNGGDGLDTAVYAGNRSAYTISTSNGVTTITGPDGTDQLTGVERLQFADGLRDINGNIIGGGGPIIGTSGDDVLDGTAQADTINGGDGNDTISGRAADDVLNGDAGNDILNGGLGADLLNGGSGTDRVSYSDATAGVVVDLAAQLAFDGASFDYMSSIENATGSGFADTLVGSDVANDLVGGAGNDNISGGAGDDVLYGDEGDDILSGGRGGDLLFGGAGIDRVTYADATTGTVVDLTAQLAFDGVNYDYMASIENATGSAFADTLVGSEGANELAGGAGNDTLSGLGGQDNLFGGDGNDTISGGAADDVLYGEAGDDVLNGGQGGDILFGGAGTDRISYIDATTGVVVDLAAQLAFDGATYDYMASIENATGSAFADTLVGSDGANDLVGGAGNDSISGGAGDDVLYGDAGDDVLSGGRGGDILFGGLGTDRVTYLDATTGVVVDLTAQIAFDGVNYDYMASIENATGSAYADTLVGSDVANDLIGGAGNDTLSGFGGQDNLYAGDGSDTLSGGVGDDVLYGEAGDDVLNGGQGGDILFGGAGTDRVSYIDATTGVVVDLAAQLAFDGANYDYMASIENATGSAFADTLEGSDVANDILGGAGNDIISGGAGDDVLAGEAGDDTLSGGQGGDILFGGEGADRVTHANATAGVVVDLTAQIAFDGASYDYMSSIENATGSSFADTLVGSDVANDLIGGAGNDTLSGLGGQDNLFGGDGNDVISGGAGDDVLAGEEGDDVLSGGQGGDIMFGGAGADRVSYIDATTGVVVDLAAQLAFDGANYDYMASIENATGSAFADTLEGSDVANDILGGGGNDVISGGAGDDVLYGEAGDDVLSGGQGGDILFGGDGLDRVTYAAATTGIVVDLTAQIAFDGANYDYMASIENATGSAFADTLVGSNVANDLIGGNGNDVLIGEGGNDRLDGGAGNDVARYLGTLSEYAIESVGNGVWQVTDLVAGRSGIDILTGIEQLSFADGSTFSLAQSAQIEALSGKAAYDQPLVLPASEADDVFVQPIAPFEKMPFDAHLEPQVQPISDDPLVLDDEPQVWPRQVTSDVLTDLDVNQYSGNHVWSGASRIANMLLLDDALHDNWFF